MPRPMIFLAATLAAASIAAPIAAQTVDQDVRCLIVSNVFAKNEKDPAKKQLAQAASLFYLGRVDARLSVPQIAAAATAQGKAMKLADAGPTMTACANRMAEKGRALQAMGQQAGAPKPK